jgi:N-dimethylarginine dimethylaminohydrolase
LICRTARNVAFISTAYDGFMAIQFLVSPPSGRRPPHHLNPWAMPKAGYDIVNGRRQWDRFVEVLACAGDVELIEIDENDNAPNLTFTGNTALIYGNLAVLSSFRDPQRRRQQDVFRAGLTGAGLATTSLREAYFEGAGNALFDRVRPLCYVGYRLNGERNATSELYEIIGCRVVPLLLVDERFYHLDMVLCSLGSGHVLAYMAAFAPQAQSQLRRSIEPRYLIEIDSADALELVCNMVEVDDSLIMHGASRRLRERLNAAGYRIFCSQLDELLSVGGGARKLALRLGDGPPGPVPSMAPSLR